MSITVRRLTAFVALGALCAPALATPINLNTDLALSVNPGSSGVWTLSATNQNNGTIANGWNAFAVAFQVVPDAGATGTVTLQSFVNPAANPSIPSASAGQPFVGQGTFPQPINGTTDFTSIVLGYSGSSFTTWASGQTYNLATITFSASADASGTWRVYASNPEDNFTDFPQTTWNLPNTNDNFFGNVPFVSGQTSTVQLGTISAVPEPRALTLAGSAAALIGGYSFRRSRRTRRAGLPNACAV